MYKPPYSNSYLPAILYWATSIFLAFAVQISLLGNIRGEVFEHWATIPLSIAALVAHFKRTLLVIPLYVIYTVFAFERIAITIYTSQSLFSLLPTTILLCLMLILWANGQYRPLRTPAQNTPSE